MLEMLLITLIIVWIIDLSGIIEELEVALAKWLKTKKVHIPKPFSCSLCVTWWSLLLFVLVTGRITLIYISLCALFAFLTPFFYDLLLWVRRVGEKIITLLYYLMGDK